MSHTARRTILIAVSLLCAVLMAGIWAVSAGNRASAGHVRQPLTEPTIPPQYPVDPTPGDDNLIMPPPICEVTCELTGGPSGFCPGQPIWFRLRITNSGQYPVTNLVVTDPLPVGVWLAENGYFGTVVGVYDSVNDCMWWDVPLLGVGETVDLGVVMRTYSSLPKGSTVETTFSGNGFNLLDPIGETLGVTIGGDECNTPTPEPTPLAAIPTPEPEPESFAICMPVIVQ